MQRCIYAIPSDSIFEDPVVAKLEQDVKDSKMLPTAFHTKLHEMPSGLKTNVTKLLLDRNVSNFSMKPVKRNYAFERSDIERKEHYVLEISYTFKVFCTFYKEGGKIYKSRNYVLHCRPAFFM